LFKYFPSKEALVFGREDDQEAALVTAVRDRAAGQSIPVGLQDDLRCAALARFALESVALVQDRPTRPPPSARYSS
jgi:AcrR family transcriptional regulator